LLILGCMVFRFPAPTIPAMVAAGLARFHFGTPPLPPFDDSISFWKMRDRSSQILPFGIAGGAIGYAALAALGIGVPAPEAELGWRIFGGIVFGAATGVFVTFAVCSVPISYRAWRSGA
jgi:hypothetical protein